MGAGGFGREVLGWALACEGFQSDWKVAGFLDSNPEALRGFECSFGIVGDPKSFTPSPQQYLVCAIGDSQTRLQLCHELKDRGAEFLSLIHPRSIVSQPSGLGEGCVVGPGAIVSPNVKVGGFVVLNMNCTIGHDSVLGDGCTISCHADIAGGAVLGKGVLVGSHGCILPRVRIGDFAVVGAGSAAYHNVPSRMTVIGVPARPMHSLRSSAGTDVTIPNREAIAQLVLASLQEEGVAIPEATGELPKVPLIGRGAMLKSVALVAMLVAVEQRLAEELGIEVSLMDERAMSQTRSPFRDVQSLVDYIEGLARPRYEPG